MRKPVFRVSDQARHSHMRLLEALNFRYRNIGVVLYVAKANILLRCAVFRCMVTARLICVFVLAYAKSSHDAAHMLFNTLGTEL